MTRLEEGHLIVALLHQGKIAEALALALQKAR